MRLAGLLALGLLLAAGCMGGSDKNPSKEASKETPKGVTNASVEERNAAVRPLGRPYSRREVKWLKRIVRWERYSAAIGKGEDAYDDVLQGEKKLPYLRRSLRPVQRCAPGLRTVVRAPPTERLEPAFELLVDACQQQRRLARATLRAFVEEDLTEVRVDAEQESERLVKRARRIMDRYLLANRPASGRRHDQEEPHRARFTRVASRIALKRVQIRCWSTRGWSRMIREWEAYTGTRVEVAGFANGRRRAYVAPEYCSDLARFTYRRWRPASGDELLDAAFAVNVLAHRGTSPARSEGRRGRDRMPRPPGHSPDSTLARNQEELWGSSRCGVLVGHLPLPAARYRTPDCRDGGLLDLDSERSVWPQHRSMHRVTLERGRDGTYLAWVDDLPGCAVRATSRRRFSRSSGAISEFVAWTGQPAAAVEIEVVEEVESAIEAEEDTEVLVAADRDALTEDDWSRVRESLARSRVELMELLGRLTDDESQSRREGSQRTLREEIEHVAFVELMYAMWTFDLRAREGLAEFLGWTRAAAEKRAAAARRKELRITRGRSGRALGGALDTPEGGEEAPVARAAPPPCARACSAASPTGPRAPSPRSGSSTARLARTPGR